MIGVLNYAGLVLVSLCCFGLYTVKYEAKEARAKLDRIEMEIRGEEEAMRELKAEWALHNRPERLAMLAERFLDLAPASPVQVVHLEALPLPLPVEAEAAIGAPAHGFFVPVSSVGPEGAQSGPSIAFTLEPDAKRAPVERVR